MEKNADIYLGSSLLYSKTKTISEQQITHQNETYFKIENYDRMQPFFMTVVSDVNHWMFISSTGGLTCGRTNAESSLFPYYTDDKIHDSCETTGPDTSLIAECEGRSCLWRPFDTKYDVYATTRNLYKNAIGNKIMFEEINHDLCLTYRYTWKNSNGYGFAKESELINTSDEAVEVRVLDGVRNILPYGVNTLLQTEKSTLVDGYKRCELHKETGLGIFTLSSILTDKAEPSESLKATTVWSSGLNNPSYLLSEQQVKAFSTGAEIVTEQDVKGRRGAYYVADTLNLAEGASAVWHIVAEVNQSASETASLIAQLNSKEELIASVLNDVEAGDLNLKRLVYEADGFQCTSNERGVHRHFSNTMFNIMRGGIYADGYTLLRDDVSEFIKVWNSEVHDRHKVFFETMPEEVDYQFLKKQAELREDRDLERLLLEYLPLTYSRRHGDPSRPWNKFSIDIKKEDGSQKLKYEGNWRDIFQNWEALSFSYPGYLKSIIAKFVNASTADGYNPYRITRDGIDWEVLDPEDPWSNIGYWGDHQLIYLLKLMELLSKVDPEGMTELTEKDIFVYADVPYRIKGFEALIEDPRNSIEYDEALSESVDERVGSKGSDGKLIHVNNEIYKVNLMEKLLVTLLGKLVNYVPDGGIWMNTQRPEWNDANNALVGYGLSMVTLYYLHRFLIYMDGLLDMTEKTSIAVSIEVKQMFEAVAEIFKGEINAETDDMTASNRMGTVRALGEAGSVYREGIYSDGFSGDKADVSVESLRVFTTNAIKHMKLTITRNRRPDGLYHSYNLIGFSKGRCEVSHLYEMLEGQVAVLSSKALGAGEVVRILEALRNSSMYRDDQRSYMLYPDKELPGFLEKNVLLESDMMSSKILKSEVEKGLTRFIEKDLNDKYHFNGIFRNAEDLENAMAATGEFPAGDIAEAGEIFTALFNHHSFTGRSGTFFKYEGLGSIYWHMVSKLLLAVQENFLEVYDKSGWSDQAERLAAFYDEIKAGIGLDKSPEAYGAFPTDAYSHTPSFAGVQQPGMTGQVKEDILSRFGELGIKLMDGRIGFEPVLLNADEYLAEPTEWVLPDELDSTGCKERSLTLEKGCLGFTFCGVPVIYRQGHEQYISISSEDGENVVIEGTNRLDRETSQRVFDRDSQIKGITVSFIQTKVNAN